MAASLGKQLVKVSTRCVLLHQVDAIQVFKGNIQAEDAAVLLAAVDGNLSRNLSAAHFELSAGSGVSGVPADFLCRLF